VSFSAHLHRLAPLPAAAAAAAAIQANSASVTGTSERLSIALSTTVQLAGGARFGHAY